MNWKRKYNEQQIHQRTLDLICLIRSCFFLLVLVLEISILTSFSVAHLTHSFSFFFLQMCDKESLSFICYSTIFVSLSAKSVSHSLAVLYTKSMARTNAIWTYIQMIILFERKTNKHRVMMTARCVLYINLFVPRLDRFFNLLLVFFFCQCMYFFSFVMKVMMMIMSVVE
jgi:hypothetical protein